MNSSRYESDDVAEELAETFHREQWRPNFTFSLKNEVHTYVLSIRWNSDVALTLRGDVHAPFIVYKGVNIRIGTENCRIAGRNVLEINAVLPNQRPGEWERRVGQINMGSREFLRLQFDADGERVLQDGSKFQRQCEGPLPLSGRRLSTERTLLRRLSHTAVTAVEQRKVNYIRCRVGDLIDMIAFGYSDGTGKAYGNSGGRWADTMGPLGSDEWLVKIEQRVGNSLDFVRFTTNLGRVESYGNPNGGRWRNDIVLQKDEYPGIVSIRRCETGFCPMILGINEPTDNDGRPHTADVSLTVFRNDYDGNVGSPYDDHDYDSSHSTSDESDEEPWAPPSVLSAEDQERLAEVNECPICFESFLTRDGNGEGLIKCITAECRHAYCKNCVLNVGAMNPPHYKGNCAVCRTEFSTRKLMYVNTNEGGVQELKLLMGEM